ncbi:MULTISPECIES: hypothetical protein [unclassified Halomonas]|uniref:hypothetical protein n=1 Tax=unclassified Halomonas TaxID=2609666 RepID=UPI0003ED6858|nr:hypothetical protein [Halomonas sp. BC04]EWH03229.1 hypothetical protein Q427_04550 [Halomonas sp. BC04]
MTPTDIVMETGALSLGNAIDHTRWAILKQAPTAFQITTEHGVLVLSDREKADLRQFLAKLLARRLEILEASY